MERTAFSFRLATAVCLAAKQQIDPRWAGFFRPTPPSFLSRHIDGHKLGPESILADQN